MKLTSATIWNLSLHEFLSRTASKLPVPGGGSVCSVSASLGLALISMALEISLENPKQSSFWDQLRLLHNAARELLESLATVADEDIQAFENYMSARKLPKQANAQKIARDEAIQTSLVYATEVPLKAARIAEQALQIAVRAASVVTRDVASDVGAGAALLSSAVSGVLLNVDANLSRLSDGEQAKSFESERRNLEERAISNGEAVLNEVKKRLHPSAV